jgi:hypothetical protein
MLVLVPGLPPEINLRMGKFAALPLQVFLAFGVGVKFLAACYKGIYYSKSMPVADTITTINLSSFKKRYIPFGFSDELFSVLSPSLIDEAQIKEVLNLSSVGPQRLVFYDRLTGILLSMAYPLVTKDLSSIFNFKLLDGDENMELSVKEGLSIEEIDSLHLQ